MIKELTTTRKQTNLEDNTLQDHWLHQNFKFFLKRGNYMKKEGNPEDIVRCNAW